MIIEKQSDTVESDMLNEARDAVLDFLDEQQDEYIMLRFDTEADQRMTWTALAEHSKQYREVLLYRQPGSYEPCIRVYNLWAIYNHKPSSQGTITLLEPIIRRNFGKSFDGFISDVVIPSFDDETNDDD